MHSAQAQSTPPAAPPASGEANKDETIVLSPFVVTADEDVGYTANSTLAGTRVRTELKDVASAISVVTSQFLQDTGSKNQQDLLVYTTNTEVAGVRGNFSAAGGASTYNENSNLLRPSNNTRVRGLDAADNTRDYFLTEIPWDGYIVDRVDLQRGPNSILFGVGSPAGIINTSINTATFKTANKIENRIGRYGSFRTSGDFNYVAKKNVLAFRAAFLDDETKYQQKPAFNHDKRLFAAMRYEPKLFGEGAHTTIRANYENGNVNANRPRSLPPIDAITPWFLTGSSNGVANLNKLTLNPNTTWNQWGNNAALYPASGGMYPWFREAFMGRLMSSNIAGYYDASTGGLYNQMPNVGTPLGRDSAGAIDGTIGDVPFARPWAIATYNNYARTAIPGGKYYSNVSLSDTSIFDFFNNLIDGNNKREWQDWNAANLALSQTFLNDRLGFEFVYDYQRYNDGQLSFLQGDQYALSVDINTKLLDGSANPNVGRPYVGNSGQYGNSENYIDRDSKRFTAFADINSEDYLGKTWLSKLLGRHVFTGLWSKDTKETDQRSFSRWASDPAFTTALGLNNDITNGARQYDWIAYLGPSLLSKSTAAGANLSPVSTVINPNGSVSLRYFDSHWNSNVDPAAPYTYTTYDSNGNAVTTTGTQADNSANYVGWKSGSFKVLNYENPGDRAALYSSAQYAKNVIESKAFIWQAYLWDGTLVPTFGWRRDEITNESRQGKKLANDVSSTDYSLTKPNLQDVAGESKSWGVVLHTPRSLRTKLPFGSNLSVFANRSKNFKADAPRGDIFGNQIDNPKAETKDYGIVISTLDDRLTFKITKYETTMKNATLQADSAGFSGNLYYAWALPYWGATHALAALDGIANPQIRQGNWGWPWNGIAVDGSGNPDPARIQAIVNDYFKSFPLTQTFADEYGLGLNVAAMRAATTNAQRYAAVPTYGVNDQGASALGLQPAYGGRLKSFGSGPVASVDTTSKGVEFEISAQPTKNWSLAVNFSKTKATRDAISPTIQTWIDSMTKFYAGDAGLIRLWGGDTLRKVWADNILAPYAVLQAQLGSAAPEISPWRFNAVTNYNFREGWLKDFNAGLAYRWEDKRILGYSYDKTKDVLDIDRPLYGPTDDHFDFWVGYQRKLSPKVGWRVQLNVRNAFEKTHLVPVNLQPDGSVALSRIQEGMIWQVTNTFTF
ncbi:TonB-dependent receptor plug domain-containing protein [Oleiharenicola sp. Vm1]|uniref:TonB-dependent receptor plug domain-containing protein n=1 Tax=Oleiharenicola sp. Vm1 TaxID=3398393 RepID=UPI0039F61570